MYKGICFLLIILKVAICQSSPTICLEQNACYIGSWINNTLETKYASFQGIRYAQPPINELRFVSPKSYKASEGMYDVKNESKIMCPQYTRDGSEIIGQEDCLFLNIYVPEIVFNNIEIKVPVMVWIYGGALLIGSNTFEEYGPHEFMKKDVIVVTVNYRLGPLGFLSLGTETVPGNGGLRDQNLALIWIKENIVNFGGNPEMVTLFGQSSGSFSIAMHLMSPLSKELFHRVILQSGTALQPSWGPITSKHALQYAEMFIDKLGCHQEMDTLSCLQEQELKDIFDAMVLIPGAGNMIWSAVPDVNFTTDPFIPGDPKLLMESGQFNTNVEVIIGTNSDEGINSLFGLIKDPTLWDEFRKDFQTNGPRGLFNIANKSEITPEDIVKMNTIVEYYIGSFDNMNENHIQDIIDMFTDAGFLFGTYKTIEHFLKQGMTVYQYILSYQGKFSFSQFVGIEPIGVCHIDDLFYLWNPVLGKDLTLPDNDKSVRDLMTSAWTNFAKIGDPTPPDCGLSWVPNEYGKDYVYWNISSSLPVMEKSQKIQERMDLWDKVMK